MRKPALLFRLLAVVCVAAGAPALGASPVPDTLYSGLKPRLFDVHANDLSDDGVPVLQPWKRIALDPRYAGSWIVTGDLTGDGRREIVSARSIGGGNDRYTCSVAAQRLDGSLLWTWGPPGAGTGRSSFDIGCQVYDWDGDGQNDVIVSTNDSLVELDGRTGKEKRRIPIPAQAADCIAFCNLSGRKRAADVLVKTRYTQIWALNPQGETLWSSKHPGGYLTAHQAVPIDIDKDGRDEILAGYTLLNADGSARWVLNDAVPFARGTDLGGGHLDCGRVLRWGKSPAEHRLVLTFCGGNRIALVNGEGEFIWRVAGAHFESADIGRVCPGVPGKHIVVDIDHQKWGQGPLCIFSEDGELLGRIVTNSSRHHLLIDWNGDGFESIVVGQAVAMFDGRGRKTALFEMKPPDGGDPPDPRSVICASADMTGDRRPDILLYTNPGTTVYVYENKNGRQLPPAELPSHSDNFTFY